MKILTRVIHGPKDRVTPLDLKVQTFRVNVEFSTYHHEQKKFLKKCPKVTFRLEKCFFRSLFETVPVEALMADKI